MHASLILLKNTRLCLWFRKKCIFARRWSGGIDGSHRCKRLIYIYILCIKTFYGKIVINGSLLVFWMAMGDMYTPNKVNL